MYQQRMQNLRKQRSFSVASYRPILKTQTPTEPPTEPVIWSDSNSWDDNNVWNDEQ